MKCRCKILSTREPASDGSMVSIPVLEEYLNSDACQEALKMKKMVGTLTHRSRNIQAVFPDKPGLQKTVGKDDSIIIVSENAPAPTHVITDLFINREDGWLYGDIEILNEESFDEIAKQNILRLKGMLKNGILPGVSAVIVGYWNSTNTGTDHLSKCVNIKGIDVTLNPSWKKATITEVTEDEKSFSEINPDDYKFDGMKVKTFSTVDYEGPKSSKINGCFTTLKAKEFSSNGVVTVLGSEEVISTPIEQKEFTVAGVKERLREAKLSPRMYFRRVYMNFKQMVRTLGGPDKMKEDDAKILKSLFTSDILYILNLIQSEVLSGKQINTLLGCSSVSKTARVAAQNLQLPFRMAMVEAQKNGFLSKMRYQKLQSAYLEFIKSLIEDVFGNNSEPIKEEEEGNE